MRPKPPAAPPKPKTEMPAKPKQDDDEWKAWYPNPKLVAWSAAGAVVIGLILLLVIWLLTRNRIKEDPHGLFVPAPPTTAAATSAATANPTAGLLQVTSAAPATTTNLTAEGKLDWVHWGSEKPEGLHRKKGVTAVLSNFTKIGAGTVKGYSGNPNHFSWTDGVTPPSNSAAKGGVLVEGTGSGFELTVPADTTPKTLRVYVGALRSTGKFEASLSDNSASPYSNNSPSNKDSTTTAVYTVNFKTASAGQKLILRYTMAEDFKGNVTLQSASLAPAP
jgi:hypothetical protein